MSEENQQFVIQKLYLKDVSFESPNSPATFTDGEWKPSVNIQINTSNQMIAADTYEVVLEVTATTKQNDKVAYLVEVKQAGIFTIAGFPEENLAGMIGAFCPETLFPYIREAISDLVIKGGFPQVLLAPVNFSALYQQKLTEAQQEQQGEQEQSGKQDTEH